MKRLLAAALLLPLPALAQSPDTLYASAKDVQAAIAKAKAEHKSDTENTHEPIVSLTGYPVQLEYRTGTTPPTVHPNEDELIEVIEGSCSFITGGTLEGAKPGAAGAMTITGATITGGSARRIAKGDYVLVPAGTPHQYTQVAGFVSIALHMPAKSGAR